MTPGAIDDVLPVGLRQWAARPGSQLILAAARRQLEAGRTGARTRVAAELDAGARRDVGRLLGLKWQRSGRPPTLGQLRKAIEGAGGDLSTLLESIGGPLRDLPAEKAAALDERTARRESVMAVLLDARLDREVVDLVIKRRWLGNADDPALLQRAADLAALLAALPRNGTLLAALASDLYGDPHALDRDHLLGRVAVRVLAAKGAAVAGVSNALSDENEPALLLAVEGSWSAAGWRATWAAAGVICDRLSSTVLALNLPLGGGGVAGALLRTAAEYGEPVWLTARSLLDIQFDLSSGEQSVTVRVCENPSIVETASDRLRAACPPLICTYGRPSTAAWSLLEALAAMGSSFLISTDRDDDGLSISRELLTRLPRAGSWLPDAGGLYEEARLMSLLEDLERAGVSKPR